MGHPLNSINYLLNNWQTLEKRYPFYAFFLFTEEDEGFYSLFQNKFVEWDQISGEACMFFAIAPPPEAWSDVAKDRDYWRHFMANSVQNSGYDHDAVVQAARYFDIPAEYLPAIVLFTDLNHYDTLSLHLSDLTVENADSFIHNLFLFLNHPNPQRYPELWRLQLLIDRLPINTKRDKSWIDKFTKQLWSRKRGSRPNYNVRGEQVAANRLVYVVNSPQTIQRTLNNLQRELRRLTEEVTDLRSEQREAFREVNTQLEGIRVVLQETVTRIENFRQPFIARWVAADDLSSSPEALLESKEKLHAEFDEFLDQQSKFLAERLYEIAPANLPPSLRPFADLLEPSSHTEIVTAELLWEHLSKANIAFPIDYSVCGIGLWKALEIEINRTFVDALRTWNGVCNPGTPSIEQTPLKRRGKVTEPGLFAGKRVDDIILYNRKWDHLGTLMFGAVVGLLANSADNSLSDILSTSPLTVESTDSLDHEFLTNLSEQIDHVVKTYRNGHSHIQVMKRATCEEFRNFYLDHSVPHSPLFATLMCKRAFLNNRLI